MERQIIWRGLLAGAAAGVLAFVFARIFVEPQINRAIGYEDGIAAARENLETAAGHAAHRCRLRFEGAERRRPVGVADEKGHVGNQHRRHPCF